jgi:hypothetical protein
MAKDDDDYHRSKRRKSSHERNDTKGKKLPFDARVLTKDDMDEFRSVFAKYLLDRKDIRIDEIASTEAYARFKSFVHKW